MASVGAYHVQASAPESTVLHLSGPRLRHAFDNLVQSAETTGGIERYVGALALKSSLFEELLSRSNADVLTQARFCDLVSFIAPARRRVGAWLAANDFNSMRRRVATLMEDLANIGTADSRLQAFVAAFPADREHRWVRDLGAEILHFAAPDLYPLMTRWIWDRRVGSGVLREIWHTEDAEEPAIEVDDGIAMYLALRDELAGFLGDNGVFRDLPFYIDLLCAHVYAGYVNDRGGHYLRADFCGDAADGLAYTRRMLGLDAVDSESGRTRLKLVDGRAWVLGTGELGN